MSESIPVYLAVEDVLSETLLRTILARSGREYEVGACYCHGGFGYLKKNIIRFNQAARHVPFVVLIDLDKSRCPPEKIRELLPYAPEENLLLRLAVRAVESWLLADGAALASILRISERLIPLRPDELPDPKTFLIDLVKRSRNRQLREAIVPARGSTARIGPGYNAELARFVQEDWDPERASKRSPSLNRAVDAICNFSPVVDRRAD